MIKTEEIWIHDPFVVTYDGKYYMYGTTCFPEHPHCDDPKSIYVYIGTDLLEWEKPRKVFTLPENFWGVDELWAPEVHLCRGKYYLFVSILGANGLRGTQIAVSDTPDGEFKVIADRPATPLTQSCIDGTLYLEDDVPYIVYSHDWPDNYIKDGDYYLGEICACQLSDDLTHPVGEPFTLFRSNDAEWSKREPTLQGWEGGNVWRYGSDGPFLQRMKNGSLLLVWSPIPAGNYVVASAISKNGSIRGSWEHLDEKVFEKNGGHAMFFDGLDGNRKMAIHCPQRWPDERPVFLDVVECGDTYKLI